MNTRFLWINGSSISPFGCQIHIPMILKWTIECPLHKYNWSTNTLSHWIHHLSYWFLIPIHTVFVFIYKIIYCLITLCHIWHYQTILTHHLLSVHLTDFLVSFLPLLRSMFFNKSVKNTLLYINFNMSLCWGMHHNEYLFFIQSHKAKQISPYLTFWMLTLTILIFLFFKYRVSFWSPHWSCLKTHYATQYGLKIVEKFVSQSPKYQDYRYVLWYMVLVF